MELIMELVYKIKQTVYLEKKMHFNILIEMFRLKEGILIPS